MMEAVRKLATGGATACRFHRKITETVLLAQDEEDTPQALSEEDEQPDIDGLNVSQRRARDISQTAQISLIWGPPGKVPRLISEHMTDSSRGQGTGKTTVVVKILEAFVQNLAEDSRILMTASTNNGKLHVNTTVQYS
jgi:hypothetical protein